MQPAPAGPYLGLRIAYLPRNSTPRQDGNYSQRRQRYAIADHIAAGGGEPVPYDEGIASGRDLGKRPAALRALDAIAAGELHGLAWEKIDRVTRDEYGTDAGIIAAQLAHRRALLVTLQRDYRLWKKEDLRIFRIESGLAGVETLDIRDRLWTGVLEKAKAEPFFMGVPPFGYTTRAELRRGSARRGGTTVKRIPVKDEKAGPVLAALAAALDECTALGEVAARLNSQGHFRWAVGGDLAGAPTRWQVVDIRRIFEKPIYEGWWTLGRDSDGTSSIWEGAGPATGLHSVAARHGGKIEALEVPQLAWFNSEQLETWRTKYAPSPDHTGPRHRKGFYPLRGVLACVSCGRTLGGWRQGYYACSKTNWHYAERRCADPQYLSEGGAMRALLEELPRALAAVKTRHEELAAAIADDDELDALRRTRDVRLKQAAALADQWYGDDSPGVVPDAVLRRLASWQVEANELAAQIARREQFLSTDPARAAAVRSVLEDPSGLVARMPAGEQLAFLRLVFADARIRTEGWGAGRRYEVVGYRNLWLDDEESGASASTPSVYHIIARFLEGHR